MEIRHRMSVQRLDATHKMKKNIKNRDVLDTLWQDGRAIPRFRCTWSFKIFI